MNWFTEKLKNPVAAGLAVATVGTAFYFGARALLRGSAADEVARRLVATGPSEFESAIGKTTLIFPASSWANARSNGLSFDETLANLDPKAWEIVRRAARALDLSEIYISSGYRVGGSGPHTRGRGLDIGYVQRRSDHVLTLLKRENGSPQQEPELARLLREQLQQDPDVTQVLDPWWMYTRSNYSRPNNESFPLDVGHLTHLHITVAA